MTRELAEGVVGSAGQAVRGYLSCVAGKVHAYKNVEAFVVTLKNGAWASPRLHIVK